MITRCLTRCGGEVVVVRDKCQVERELRKLLGISGIVALVTFLIFVGQLGQFQHPLLIHLVRHTMARRHKTSFRIIMEALLLQIRHAIHFPSMCIVFTNLTAYIQFVTNLIQPVPNPKIFFRAVI